MKEQELLSTGELARMAGVSVRTLQYYDEQDVLKPFVTEGGRRRYTRDNVIRLEQILFLKSLGFSLEEIKEKMGKMSSPSDFENAFLQQRKIISDQIENLNEIVKMLDTAVGEIQSGHEVNMDRLLAIMESMRQGNPFAFVIKYFDHDQLKSVVPQIFDKSNVIDFEGIFEKFEELYEKGTDPSAKESQELAAQWWNGVKRFTSGDVKLLNLLFKIGRDVQNWPDDFQNTKVPMENFVKKSLSTYFRNTGIQIDEKQSQ